jgi:hypothetical protein
VSFPDLPFIPDLPQHRVENMTTRQVLNQSMAALHAAEDALQELETTRDAKRQFALIRQVVIECRRSTFVLQKLSSRVVDWGAWYEVRQKLMRADPLLKYFADLRTQIEKQGLPAAMAEVVDVESGITIADVACGEDEFGIWTAGVARRDANGDPAVEPGELERDRLMLRNFRLADPPSSHLGDELTDLRFTELARRVIAYLRHHVLSPAVEEFARGSVPGAD